MTTDHKFLKVSRGFANTAIHLRVPAADVSKADAAFAAFEDQHPGCHTAWVDGSAIAYRAVDWADRAYVGL